MTNVICDKIQSCSREGWTRKARDFLVNVRIWLQEHGESALVIGIAVGILLVLAWAYVLAAVIIMLIVATVIWLVAKPEAVVSSGSPDSVSVSNSSVENKETRD